MLADIADQLYALPPEQFTAAREQAAKADRALAKQIKALRKPTASAHLVNALVRAEPALLDELLELGPALAQAQRDSDGAAVRALGDQRRRLVTAVADRAAQLAGGPVSAAVRAEVAGTLEAGLAEPASAAAVRSGRLVRALAFAGFGGVDLDGAVAAPSARPKAPARTAPVDDARARVAEAEQAALQAAGALDDAVRARESAAAAYDAAQAEAARAAQAHQRLLAQVTEAERSVVGADKAEQAARARLDAGSDEVAKAQELAEQTRRVLDALRRKG